MDSGVLAVVAIVVVFAGLYLWQKLTTAATKGITRAVAHKTHVRGQDAVHRQLDFSVPGTAQTFLNLITQRLEVVPNPPAINHDLYLLAQSDDLLV